MNTETSQVVFNRNGLFWWRDGNRPLFLSCSFAKASISNPGSRKPCKRWWVGGRLLVATWTDFLQEGRIHDGCCINHTAESLDVLRAPERGWSIVLEGTVHLSLHDCIYISSWLVIPKMYPFILPKAHDECSVFGYVNELIGKKYFDCKNEKRWMRGYNVLLYYLLYIMEYDIMNYVVVGW